MAGHDFDRGVSSPEREALVGDLPASPQMPDGPLGLGMTATGAVSSPEREALVGSKRPRRIWASHPQFDNIGMVAHNSQICGLKEIFQEKY